MPLQLLYVILVCLNVFFVVAYCSPYSRPGDRLLRLLAMTGEAVCLCVAALTLLRCRDVVSTICSDLGYQKEQTDKVTARVQASGLANCTVSSMSESKLMVKNVYFCLPFRLTCGKNEGRSSWSSLECHSKTAGGGVIFT